MQLGADGVDAFGRDEVAFGEGDETVAEAQQGQDVEVFAGLGHDAVVGGDDEDDAVDAGGPGDHGLDEVFVAGDVDDADFEAAEIARGEAQLDAHAAFFFLLEAVGFTAGEQFDEGGFAVVDVTGGAEGDVDLC